MELLHDSLVDVFFALNAFGRYVFIFILAFGEGLPVIGSFLPGGTIALLIGSLSEESFINPWHAVHLIAIGSLIGDLLAFFLSKKLLTIRQVRELVNAEKHAKKWDLFDRNAALIIIFGKVLPVVRSVPSLFAGVRRMNKTRYVIYATIGSYAWALFGIFGGKYLAQIFGDSAVVVILFFLIISASVTLISWLKKRMRKRKEALEK